ncbi:hypothetical protein NL108_018100 [Boleophthalmus pectinirostris]|nr:hypothetical protein NL108_018100 [Boleophthalmus pectinirostris]
MLHLVIKLRLSTFCSFNPIYRQINVLICGSTSVFIYGVICLCVSVLSLNTPQSHVLSLNTPQSHVLSLNTPQSHVTHVCLFTPADTDPNTEIIFFLRTIGLSMD